MPIYAYTASVGVESMAQHRGVSYDVCAVQVFENTILQYLQRPITKSIDYLLQFITMII